MPTATFYPSVFRHPSKRSQFNRPQPKPAPPPDFTQAVRQAKEAVAATPKPKPSWLEAKEITIANLIWANEMNNKWGEKFESLHPMAMGAICGCMVFAFYLVVKPIVNHFTPLPVKPVPTVQVK